MDTSSEIGVAPGGLPLLGHALQMLRHPLDFLTSLRGTGDVVKIRLGPEWAYLVRHPDLVKQVLADAYTFDKGGIVFDKARNILGNGLATCPAGDHLRQRRLLQPAFSRERLINYAVCMRDAARTRVESWHDGQVVEVDREMGSLALTVATRTLFSMDSVAESPEEIQASIQTILSGIYRRVITPFEVVLRVPTRKNREFDQAMARMYSVIHQITEDYRTAGIDRGDLLSALLAARDEDGTTGLTNREIRDQILALFLAGIETTAAAMTWSFHLMGHHPEVEARLHAEVDTLLGDKPPGFEDVPKLTHAHRVITEALRLYPPLWLLTRRTTAEVKLGNHLLQPGTAILFSSYAMHRDATYFEHPERFDPDRWLPERAKAVPRGAMIPFSAGKRKCLGDTFGMTEATIALATVARRWRLRPVPGKRISSIARITLAPGAVPMRVERRS
ncbi:cytochrome P450 [Chondromyces crocatus]|uniref:Cytochrome P450 n=1 Tax=Chondromyces crocatus TaxID=52 RepID=A0A0K1E9M0_CHOCO|nr:cytochrome P450 [Chondromyces crocatus]AKT37554.1 cytochrome P450 [Chondromyces crocatus]